MANKILRTPIFDKYYKLYKRKFKSLPDELNKLENELLINPTIGENLGNGLFKIRLAVKSKGKGKSGGFRVITYLINEVDDDKIINLLILYDKSEVSDISKQELLQIVKKIFNG